MSDSHGDGLTVEEIRDRYLGKVDANFHDGDWNPPRFTTLGRNPGSQSEHGFLLRPSQNASDSTGSHQDYPDSRTLI